MVATIHYRWDFIGLSTQEKPTPETSDKVVDGSTFYSSDDSKLYVWYKDQWYERKALGEGSGGGSTINVVQTTGESTTDVMSQKAVTDALADKQNTLTAGDGINISNDEINGVDFVGTDGTAAGEAGLVPAPATTDAGKFLKADGTWDNAVAGAGGGGGVKILTADDYNWNSTTNTAVEPFDSVALWLLESGVYMRADSSVVAYRNIDGGTMLVDEVYILGSNANQRPIVYYAYADTGSGRERVGYVEFVYSSTSTLSGQLYKSIPITAPVNNLTSTTTSFPLSANQGKVLNDKITALEARVAALEGN